METIINTQNGRMIKNGDIVKLNSSGLLLNENKCWKHIPVKDISIEHIYAGEYFKQENLPELELTSAMHQFDENDNDTVNNYTEKAKCFFGIKNLEFCKKKYFRASAICSNPVTVDNCEYVTLAVSAAPSDNSNAEYYIVDGISEQPVLPQGTDTVTKEKLFFGLPTRFKIDASKPVVLYRDNEEVNDSYLGLSYDDFEEHEYMLDYTPFGETHKYRPENRQVQIKIILRCFGDNYTPLRIESVLLNKYGDKLSWNLKNQLNTETNT